MTEQKNFTIKSSFNRLFFRLKPGQKITVSPEDFESLKFAAEWINKCQEKTLRDQQLFAKVYCKLFGYELLWQGNMIDAKRSMHHYCKQSLWDHIKWFAQVFNSHHYMLYLKTRGIPVEDEKYTNEEAQELIKWAIENDPLFKKYLLGYWPVEKIEPKLIADIQDMINDYKNLP